MKNKTKKKKSIAIKIFSYHILHLIAIISHIAAVQLSMVESLFPGHDAMVNIVGTFAEIIAGLYGITLASYTFFLSRIDTLTAEDTTLEYVADSIKDSYKYLIWNITTNVVLVLLISGGLLYLPPVVGTTSFFYRLFFNEFLLFWIHSTILILYYSVNVVAPNCLEKQAEKLKKKLVDPKGNDGNVYDFLSLYERIVCHCETLIPEEILVPMQAQKGRRFSCTLELLKGKTQISDAIWENLLKLYRYHSCVVNCNTIFVKQEMCDLAQTTLEQLQQPPDHTSTEPPKACTSDGDCEDSSTRFTHSE